MNEENKQLDILAIGDITTDAFIKLEDAEVHCDVDKENCKLCVSVYVQKAGHCCGCSCASYFAPVRMGTYNITRRDGRSIEENSTHRAVAGCESLVCGAWTNYLCSY